jgi:hypothetical protein
MSGKYLLEPSIIVSVRKAGRNPSKNQPHPGSRRMGLNFSLFFPLLLLA